VGVRLVNPHGVRRLSLVIEQNGTAVASLDTQNSWNWLTFWRAHKDPEVRHFIAGQSITSKLHEGKARLVLIAESNDLRAAADSIAADIDIILKPPTVTADGFQHYINQGGSELVLLTPSGLWSDAGVRSGDVEYPSFPVTGNAAERASLFAFPWDMPLKTQPVVFVRNAAGNVATATFWFKITPKKFRSRDLAIDDQFLNKVVNQIDPGGSGDLLTRFLRINSQLRRENNQTLANLRQKTADHFLWTQPFLQLANSKVESEFADVRTYVYQGKKVDQQVHLGFDLAVVAHTPVVAANDGKVVWAAPLGIYGNCIVVDHGMGLQSIYGHLSEIGVKDGDPVKRGAVMGKSGSTGLAGGDHLHFSMQVNGVQVNPMEWWDDHWIKDHVRDRLK
jgi:murein DD-endopeptidase MepM/ murein hydrolase activator NlpD